jgi:hypothetical protein
MGIALSISIDYAGYQKNIFPAIYLRIFCDRFYQQQLQGVLWSS